MIVNEALAALAGDFSTLYSPMGRPSIPPEKLPGNAAANLLFNPSFDGAAGVRPSFPWVCRDRRRRLGVGPFGVLEEPRSAAGVTSPAKFLSAVLAQPSVKKLLSTDHFSVDGTLIEAWASMKSVKPNDGSGERPAEGGGRNIERDFHGQKRSNDTHASTSSIPRPDYTAKGEARRRSCASLDMA